MTETTTSFHRLLKRSEILDFISGLEPLRDPEILVDVLHLEEHRKTIDELEHTIRQVFETASELKDSFLKIR